MDLYLDLINISIDDIQTKITIFRSVTLENDVIIRANSNYYKKPWFSNIAIIMDFLNIFKVLLIIYIKLEKGKPLLNLSLI